MQGVLESAVRAFCESEHIRNILQGQWTSLYDETGRELDGIRGRMGVSAITLEGHEIGVDLVEMQPGSKFELHTHPGSHILYVVNGTGCVVIDDKEHAVSKGDSIFIPAEYPHGVKTIPGYDAEFTFLAFGVPHKHLDATDRMKLVRPSARDDAA